MSMIRRQIKLTSSRIETVTKHAVASERTNSELLRDLVDEFLAVGSTYQPEESRNIGFLLEPEVLARAEAKAASENGCSLQEVLRHRVAMLSA